MQVERLDCAEKRTVELKTNISRSIEVGTKNLKPAKPGEIRNPNGRPKGSKDSLRAQLRRYMRMHPTVPVEKALDAIGVDPTAIDNAGALAATLFHQAIVSQDVQAARLIATHCERPLKTDQPDIAAITNNHTQVMIYIPDNGRERGQLAASAAAEALALPVIDAEARAIAPPVDPMDELAGFVI